MRILLGLLSFVVALAAEPVPTKTIIDVISSSPQFSEFLRLLQEHELVPLINNSWNCTLLAPVNTAFLDIDKNSITRDQLLYHLINDTAYSEDFGAGTRIYKTFLDHGKAPISLSLSHGVNNEAEFDDLDMLASPQRGLVHSISNVVYIPPTLSKQMFLDRHVQGFATLIDHDVKFDGRTVLAPLTTSIEEWIVDAVGDKNSTGPILSYLQSPFGKADRKALIRRHTYDGLLNPAGSPQDLVLQDGTPVTVFENFTVVGPGFAADASSYIQVARDGLLLELSRVIAGDAAEFLELTPEKFIIGLGGYPLVRAVTSYGYRHLIDGTQPHEGEQSIIVPTGGDDSRYSMSANPSSLILYQFLEGALPQNVDSCLINTLMPLRSWKAHQRVHFERRESGSVSLNWENVEPQSYRWGNTSFYTSAELLTTPPSLTMALGPLLISSFSLSFLDKLDRLQLPFTNSWTVFVPTRDAWEKELLLKKFLDSNTVALERVFDNLILQEPVYSDSEQKVVKQFSGVPTTIEWNASLNSFILENAELHGIVEAESTDALFDNGVAHIVNQIPLPQDLEISTEDLIVAGDRSYFLDLLAAADMDFVLDPAANYTILVPPTRDLQKNNYTVNTKVSKLQEMLNLHLIPNNSIDQLADGQVATTLSGEKLELFSIGPMSKFWGLTPVGARGGQRVLLYESGHTNGKKWGGSTVMFLDRHISPRWIGPMGSLLRSATLLILGILFGLVIGDVIVFGMVWLLSRRSIEPEHEDVENGYHDEEDPQTEPAPDGRASGDGDGPAASNPIETPSVSEERMYGRHLNLPQ